MKRQDPVQGLLVPPLEVCCMRVLGELQDPEGGQDLLLGLDPLLAFVRFLWFAC